ncbi:MAG TPA: N-6 DNA methylase [Candidatus Lokiarchaeia archaeon]|nr:N-6 DNA methylase [Candidatus Lokiarchaeia archaeon]
MLRTWMDQVRVNINDLFERDDAAFLQNLKRWRLIEREIHEFPADEPGFMATQISFLLLIVFEYSRLELAKDIDADNFSTLGIIASKLCDDLENDSEKFLPYLEIVRLAITPDASIPSTEFSTIFKAIYEEHDATIELLFKAMPGLDVLSHLYQELFSNPAKHASGEHYTPVTLCELMIDQLPITHENTILDPTCGAGAFIVAAINHVKNRFHPKGTAWLKNIHGEDINPVAIIAARINAWMQARDLELPITFFFDTIRISDILDRVQDKHDFIIGNPPWITLKDFTTPGRQKMALALAKELQIEPDAHGVPQLELATIVFSKCLRDRLVQGGQIFLIMTSSFIDGKHCSKFRTFTGIDSVKIWLFEGEPVFPRKFACLLAKKGLARSSYFENQSTLDFTTWKVTRAGDAPCPAFAFSELETSKYSPVNLAKLSGANPGEQPLGVEKLIPVDAASTLLPTDSSTSHYKALCYNGATIFPQSLLFVDIIDRRDTGDDAVITIRPAFGLHMKKPWNVQIYQSTRVERRYIFDLVKGSELYPFGTGTPFQVFLPLKTTTDSFTFDGDGIEPGSHISLNKPSLASSHFARINKYYKNNCKNGGRIADLWARINFDNELTNPGMSKPYKVIFPDCGSTMAAAIVKGPCIVEHALHYVGLDDEDEAYYLIGVLNAPCIEKDVLLRKAERHIGQLLLDYVIPCFDPANQDHQDIANLSRKMEGIVRNMVEDAETSVIAANVGKYQCKACLAFVKETGWQAHAHSCKNLLSSKSTMDETGLFIIVDGNRNDDVHVKFTRDAIKKKIAANARLQQLLSELDGCVLRLLGTRDS